MVKSGFEFEAFKHLTDQFKKSVDESVIDQFIRDFLFDMAKKLIAKTKRKTPKNTGLLRNSWMIGNIEKHGNNYIVEVYTDVEYAEYVEYGFRAHWVPGEWKGKQFVYDSNAKTGMQVGKPGGWVGGRFMLTISEKELEREFPKYLQKKQEEFLREILLGHLRKRGSK